MFEELQKLIPDKNKELFSLYLQYIYICYQHFAVSDTESMVKKEQIQLLDKAIRKDFPLQNNMLSKLQKMFVRENLSLYLLLDPLIAWRYLINKNNIKSEKQISEIIGYIASPVARLIMVLNNENPSTYLAMTSYVSALIYQQLFLQKIKVVKLAKKSHKNRIKYLQSLLKSSEVLLEIVCSKPLKYKFALTFNKKLKEIDKMLNNKQVKIGILDEVGIFLYSIWQFLTIRHKTINKKGI